MRIERKVPLVGQTFERTFSGKSYKLKVVPAGEGLAFELNGRIYKTPTAAAKAITKFEVNGWRFWYMKREDK